MLLRRSRIGTASIQHNYDCNTRLTDVNRSGIAEKELNKYLETKGLRRVRIRMNCIVRYMRIHAPRTIIDSRHICWICEVVPVENKVVVVVSVAGTWLFDARRWLDPAVLADRQRLLQVRLALTFFFSVHDDVYTFPSSISMHISA